MVLRLDARLAGRNHAVSNIFRIAEGALAGRRSLSIPSLPFVHQTAMRAANDVIRELIIPLLGIVFFVLLPIVVAGSR